jgi:hypothetical protein
VETRPLVGDGILWPEELLRILASTLREAVRVFN